MDNKKIEKLVQGLVCDNPNCDWEDFTIKEEEYSNWLNKQCPKCGDIVLTEDDFNNLKILNNTVDLINNISQKELEELNKIFEELGFKNSEYIESIKGSDLLNEDGDDLLKMTIRTHKGINIESIEKFKKD